MDFLDWDNFFLTKKVGGFFQPSLNPPALHNEGDFSISFGNKITIGPVVTNHQSLKKVRFGMEIFNHTQNILTLIPHCTLFPPLILIYIICILRHIQ